MTRTTYTAEYKTKLVLEVVREESRLEEIAAANEINPNMLRNWKQEFLRNILPEGVKDGKTCKTEEGGSPGEGKDQDAEENRSAHT